MQELQKFTAKHHKVVMQTIANAQAKALATKTPMPDRKSILREACVHNSYFNKETADAQEALAAYEAAIAQVGSAPRPSKAEQQLAAPIQATLPQPPSKKQQLLGHLKWQSIHLSRLPKLLAVTPAKAEAIAQQLLNDGLVEIKRYPEKIDPKREFNRLVLKQQQEKEAA
ncbi:MAG: hypothetical protein KME42_28285 [Tildeniella nuda ZEHNDER 1965/U140]|nr:hypothetical protein [Tildeniella nuda ZEHNDER 1965/U140]